MAQGFKWIPGSELKTPTDHFEGVVRGSLSTWLPLKHPDLTDTAVLGKLVIPHLQAEHDAALDTDVVLVVLLGGGGESDDLYKHKTREYVGNYIC